MSRTRQLLPAAFLALVAGCASGPDYQRPTVELPAAWRAPAVPAELPQGGPELLDSAWWSAFGDAQLDELVRTAVAENKDLRIAAYRVEQFDAFLQVSQAAGGPQAGYEGSRLRNTLSENRQVPLAAGTRPVDNDYMAGLHASWELDLWGKVSRANEAAYAELLAAEETRRALVQSLVAEVATGYVRLLALDRTLELLKSQIESQRETLNLTEAKFRGGGIPEAPVMRAQADLRELQAEVPAKEAEIAALENALSLLAGRNPGPIARGKAFEQLALPAVPGGLPSELLAQRPDVRKAEQDLISANAKIGVAKSQYLPSISLTGSTGFASNELSKLTMLTSNFGSFGVAVLGPLFTSGRISGQVREAESVQKQAEVGFLRSVQTALREVEDALVLHAKTGERLRFNALQIEALRAQRALAAKRYEGGGSGYLEVLEAERQLIGGLQVQNQTKRDQFASLVAVYKAMGGGWSLPELKNSRPPTLADRQ